jgi:short-subunit dehydrogenase
MVTEPADDAADRPDDPAAATVDPRHLLIIGAGPGVAGAVARRFARGGYRVTLLARSPDRLAELARDLAGTAAAVDTVSADAGDPDGLRAILSALYARHGAPGILVYNAALLSPDSLLDSDVVHLQHAYNVDVVGAVIATQVAAVPMRAAGVGTILFTSGHPGPNLATLALGKAALRSAAAILCAELADDGVRVAGITIGGAVAAGTSLSPGRIAEAYWTIVHSAGAWRSEFLIDGT